MNYDRGPSVALEITVYLEAWGNARKGSREERDLTALLDSLSASTQKRPSSASDAQSISYLSVVYDLSSCDYT